MNNNKNYALLFSLLTIFSFSTIISMEKSSCDLPKGLSNSYLDVIHTTLDNVETPISTSKTSPEGDYNAAELALGNPVLSNFISQYISEDVVKQREEDCLQALGLNNYPQFKNSLAMLKIVGAKFNENDSNHEYFGSCKFKTGKYHTLYKTTFLHLACENRNIKNNLQAATIAIVEELIKHKVDLNDKNTQGETVIHKIVRELGFCPEHKNHYQQIMKLLVDAGANIHEKSSDADNRSPLSLAVEHCNITAVKMLLELGAAQGETFLMDMSFSYDKKFKQKLDEICTVTILKKGVLMQRVFEHRVIRISLAPKYELSNENDELSNEELWSCTIS